MKISGNHFPLDRPPWNWRWFWIVLAILALVIHYALGPSALFPVLLVAPIMLSAWHAGAPFAVGLTVAMSLIRYSFYFLWSPPRSFFEEAVIWLFRSLMLILVALLTARVATLHRALLYRVKVLEGILPICSFCKRIRDEREEWKQLEAFITERSAAKFSHSLCPDCAKQHYGDLLKDGDTKVSVSRDSP